MKKIGLMALSLCLVAVLAVGGTLAYLTDTDEEINVMTVGKVTVNLIEQQRTEDGTALEDFEQAKNLTPLVGSAQGTKDNWGMPVATNYVDKIVYAKNTGTNDAWMRILVAVPAALDNANDAQAAIHWNLGNRVDIEGNGAYNVSDANNPYYDFNGCEFEAEVTIDGQQYNLYSFTVKEITKPGYVSGAAIAGFYLDSAVNYDDEKGYYVKGDTKIDYDLSKGVSIPVMVQAVQADGFATAEAAFIGAGFDDAAGKAVNPWANAVFPTVVSSVEAIERAIADGETDLMIAGMESVPQGAFTDNTTIESVSVAEGIEGIGAHAFKRCAALNSVDLPSSLTSIGFSAFQQCTSLESIVIPEGVTTIEGQAFYASTNLSNIVIPNTVTAIADKAFEGTGVTSVTIPASVTTIGNYAFRDCANLTEVTILGDNVTFTGTSMVFSNTQGGVLNSLTSIKVQNEGVKNALIAASSSQSSGTQNIANIITVLN